MQYSSIHYDLINIEDTEKLAKIFVNTYLSLKDQNKDFIIFLQGELGAGKTTFVRYFLQELGFAGTVKSPTYTVVEEYHFPKNAITVLHFDLYRLKHPEELEEMGFREYLSSENPLLFLIEWPELGGKFLPNPDLSIRLTFEKDQQKEKKVANEKDKVNEKDTANEKDNLEGDSNRRHCTIVCHNTKAYNILLKFKNELKND